MSSGFLLTIRLVTIWNCRVDRIIVIMEISYLANMTGNKYAVYGDMLDSANSNEAILLVLLQLASDTVLFSGNLHTRKYISWLYVLVNLLN